MKSIMILIFLFSLLDARMHIYSLETKSEFLLELANKKLKTVQLDSTYGLGTNSKELEFSFEGLFFKNKNLKINVATSRVLSSKTDKLFKVKIKKYVAVTEVKRDNVYLGTVRWSNIAELNKGLSNISKSTLILSKK